MEAQSNNGTAPWLSKDEAARRLQVSTRTIETWVSERKLGSKLQPVEGRRPMTVVDAQDVDRLAAEQHRGAILPPEREPASMALATIAPQIVALVTALREALPPPATLPPAPVYAGPKPFMTLEEAAEFTSLPVKLLRRLIRQKRLAAERFRTSRKEPTVIYVKTNDLRYIEFGATAENSAGNVEELRDLRKAGTV